MRSDTTTHLTSILQQFPLFAGLADPHLADLARAARHCTIQRHQALFRVGDAVGELYLLVSGQVKLALSCDRGSETIIDIIDAGRSFGEAELFGQRPCNANAIATQPSRILAIARDALFQVMALDPRIALHVTTLLAQRQIDMEIELATRQTHSAPRRLLDYLLRQAGPQRARTGDTLVTLGVSKQLLAARFGMQPESLSRTLRSLAGAGLIEVHRSSIRLQNSRIERYLADEMAAQAPAALPKPRPREGDSALVLTARGAIRRRSDPGSLCDSINQAGRQRMLSQRMAKSWLMLERGVLARRSRLVLRQSVVMFDHNLRELDPIADSAGLRSVHAELSAAWRHYQRLIDAEPARKAAHELFRVNEEVLGAAQRLTQALARADGTQKAQLVNLAGRERMLSQRIAKFFLFRGMGIQVARCRAEIESAGAEFASTLSGLITAAPLEPAIAGELGSVARHWNGLRAELTGDMDAEFRVAATRVFSSSERILQHMDSAVGLYLDLPAAEIPRH